MDAQKLRLEEEIQKHKGFLQSTELFTYVGVAPFGVDPKYGLVKDSKHCSHHFTDNTYGDVFRYYLLTRHTQIKGIKGFEALERNNFDVRCVLISEAIIKPGGSHGEFNDFDLVVRQEVIYRPTIIVLPKSFPDDYYMDLTNNDLLRDLVNFKNYVLAKAAEKLKSAQQSLQNFLGSEEYHRYLRRAEESQRMSANPLIKPGTKI